MERSRIIPAIYGYGVCLIAVIVFLVSIAGFVNNAFRTAYPESGGFHHRVALHGFGPRGFRPGGFMHGGGVGQRTGPPSAAQGASPNSAQVTPVAGAQSQRSTNFRTGFIARARLQAARSLIIDFVLLVASVLLFLSHWRWLNALQRA